MSTEQEHDPGAKSAPMMNEADIGSGERTPAQQETDKMINDIPPLKPDAQNGQDAGTSGKAQPGQ